MLHAEGKLGRSQTLGHKPTTWLPFRDGGCSEGKKQREGTESRAKPHTKERRYREEDFLRAYQASSSSYFYIRNCRRGGAVALDGGGGRAKESLEKYAIRKEYRAQQARCENEDEVVH